MTGKSNPFPDIEHKGFVFSKADMTNVKFDGVNLSESYFWAVLRKAEFKDCNMESAIFDDVNLSGSSYENINLSGTTFNNINMSGVSFSNLNMANVDISNANMDGMKINGVLVTDLFDAYEKAAN